MIIAFFLSIILLFLMYDKYGFSFAILSENNLFSSPFKTSFNLSDIKSSIRLNVAPVVAAAGKGIMGILGKGGGGKMGGMLGKMGGGGGGGGKGGGGMMSSAINGATKPLKASMSLATGLVQGIKASRLKKKAEAAFPELVDPKQASFLAELAQKKKSIDTGADFASGMQQIDTTNAGTNDAVIKAGGGDVGATMQGLLEAQMGAGIAKNNVLAQGQQQQYAYTNSYEDMLDKMSARKLQLQLLRNNQLNAQWDSASKASKANLAAGAAGLMPGGNKEGQPGVIPEQGNGLNIGQMAALGSQIKGKTGLENTPSAPSSNPVSAPTVTPKVSQAQSGLGTPINTNGAAPLMSLIKK
jgi:hypothetical protein